MDLFETACDELPLVAILRGLEPKQALDVGCVLVDAGFRLVEVPLNSPHPLRSIETLAGRFGKEAVVGAGTVLDTRSVEEVAGAGGRLIVTPHTDAEIIEASVMRGLYCCPGFATPSEAFTALRAGATALKLFPAEAAPPRVLGALRAVLPRDVRVFPVGGITPDAMAEYVRAGAAGFGLGSALFKPGMTPADVDERAKAFVRAWRALRAN